MVINLVISGATGVLLVEHAFFNLEVAAYLVSGRHQTALPGQTASAWQQGGRAYFLRMTGL